MKKSVTTFLFLTGLIFNSHAQNSLLHKKDSVLKKILTDKSYCEPFDWRDSKEEYYYTNKQYITNYTLSRLIRKDLTKITLDEDGLPSLGNYATTKLSDNDSKVAFNASMYNILKKKDSFDVKPIRNILTVNINAGINEGIASLFTNKNLNNEAGVKLKLSLLSKRTLYANDSAVDCATLKLYRERIYFDYKNYYTKSVLADSLYQRKARKFGADAIELRHNRDSVQKRIDSLSRLVPKPGNLIMLEYTILDSTISKYLELIDTYSTFQDAKPKYDSAQAIDSFYRRLLNTETKYTKWNRITLRWWDIDFNGTGIKYNLFNKALAVDSQISKKNFTQWGLGFTYNIFKSDPGHQFFKYGLFFKLGYLLANDNSLSGLTPKELSNTITVDTPNFKRQVVEKINVYDVPFEKIYSHTIKAQLSKYLNEKKSSSLSLYLTTVLSFKEMKKFVSIQGKPAITPGIGYQIGIPDKEKEKSVINLEVFLNFNDVLNSAEDKTTNAFTRHQFGIKFGVPFNSIFLNQ